MDLKIKRHTNKVIRKQISDDIERVGQRVIQYLFVIGEKCVNDARLQGSYKDQTGNLRGSTGYAVVDKGKVITVGGLKEVKGSAEGPAKGEAYLEELVSQLDSSGGPVLIVVAGMNYAKYVADKGYNVLDSAELLAEQLISELQNKLAK